MLRAENKTLLWDPEPEALKGLIRGSGFPQEKGLGVQVSDVGF